ncbi:MAG: UDP-4-amino-4,6-dideoxy-N-acetyl-beta-L-altrosamine transaminase [Bacillota bacterium]
MTEENSYEDFLPYACQSLDEKDIAAVTEVLKGDWLTTGPKINEFEQAVADYCGAEYAVAVSSGTAALHAACFAAGIGEEDEVITTPLTFAATANSVLYCGGKPVFADVDPQTYNLSPGAVREKVNENTKAVIPVDYTGQPVNMDAINEIAAENDLVVIEDACHAIGAEYKGQKVGSLADMAVFSFHPVKHITSGEGGMVLTDNEEYYKKLKQFRTHGITKAEEEFTGDSHGPWFYEQQFLGYNYRMTDIQAALGLSQLNKLDQFIARRREIVREYNRAFSDMDEIITPYQHPDTDSSWHLYVIQVKVDRKEMFNCLLEHNIGANVHYIPVYYHPYYLNQGYEKGICPEAEKIYNKIITLPLFPAIKDEDVERVIETVKKCLQT